MSLTVFEAKAYIANEFPEFIVSFNPSLKSINVYYRDIEFSITSAYDDGRKCYAVKKFDRVIREPYIVKFVEDLEQAVLFIKEYSNIYEQLYINLF